MHLCPLFLTNSALTSPWRFFAMTSLIGKLSELAYEDLILLINTSSSVRKVVFELVRNVKSVDFPEGNCKISWDRLVSKCAPHTALSLLKLKSDFHNSRFESIEKEPDKWITNFGRALNSNEQLWAPR